MFFLIDNIYKILFDDKTNLFVDPKQPCLYVRVVIMRYMIDGEHRTVFFGMSTFRPKRRVLLLQ